MTTIWDYQRQTGARSGKFGAWVSSLGFNPNTAACGDQAQAMAFTPDAPLGGTGISAGAVMTSSGLYK